MAKGTDKDDALKRLGGGRWQTRDERFTIEPQSGTWVVVDAEQTDDLGLALVRGPFGSLTAAKAAIETARDTAPAESPLRSRAAKLRDRPAAPNTAGKGTKAGKDGPGPSDAVSAKSGAAARPKPDVLAEPRWLRDLEPAERRRATRLIDRLTGAGAADAESIARRDVVGAVPAAAAFAIERALAGMGDDARPAAIARLLADGRDDDLGVRWRLVDGEGRPITLDLESPKRR